MPVAQSDITKKGHTKDRYQDERVLELAKCMVDPLYFIEKYVMIQHPLEGRVPFKLYPFQANMIKAFHEHRNTILCTSRQMGKSSAYNTMISKNGELIKLGQLIKLGFKERMVKYLEDLLIEYVTS